MSWALGEYMKSRTARSDAHDGILDGWSDWGWEHMVIARAQVPVVCAGIAYITVEGAEMHSRVTLAALSVPTA